MKTAALLALLFASSSSFAAEPPKPKAMPPVKGALSSPERLAKGGPIGSGNFKISFKLSTKGLSHEGSFVVQEGAQANYIDGGEDPSEIKNAQGTGIEFKKRAALVNCVAVSNPNAKGRARAECQFELSGPVKRPGSDMVPGIETMQLQTAFEADYGKPVVLADGPDRHVEVVVDEIK